MHSQFLNTRDDCQWLQETHLKNLKPPVFASYELYGNEDCPEEIVLHAKRDPLVSDNALAIYRRDKSGNLKLSTPPR